LIKLLEKLLLMALSYFQTIRAVLQRFRSTRLAKSMLPRNRKGQSIVEIVIAVGLFTLILSSVVVLYLGVFKTNLRDAEKLQADMYLQQGLEAVRSIRDFSFANLTNGTHGLTRTNGYWEFSGASDVQGQFTRTVLVEDVQRSGASLVTNADCLVVASGGLTDNKEKKITTTITWNLETAATSVSTIEYINKWTDQSGCDESSWLTVDTSTVTLAAGNRQIEGIDVENTGASDITIASLVPTWENDANITEVKMGNSTIWKSTGGYSPAGAQVSGVELDVTDYLLSPTGGTPEINKIRFDGSMEDIAFTLLFKMDDTTGRYIESFGADASCPSQADSMTVDTSGASIGGGGSKQLLGITIQNTHATCLIRIDKYTLTWGNGEQISKIRTDAQNVWVWNGAGTPDGKQNTGVELDADDTSLAAGSGVKNIDYFEFEGNMTGETFTITFTMNDETTKVISNLSP
jgi:hypothetical protein